MNSDLLSVRDVSVRFGGLMALSDVNLDVQPGERVGLIGPNGAGKTTLVNTIAGEIRPTRGLVSLSGSNMTRLRPFRRFRSGLARTFQVAHPFPALSVLDAVMIGPLSRGMSLTEARAAAVGALDVLGGEIDGDKTMRDLNPVTSKLVELARIVASQPSLVLLDELLAGLMPIERERVLDRLEELSHTRGWATIMIEHLIGDVRRFCDRVVVLDRGAVIADGPTEDVLSDRRVIEAYLGEPGKGAVVDPVTESRDGMER